MDYINFGLRRIHGPKNCRLASYHLNTFLSAQAYPGLILGHGRIVGHGHGFGLKILTCRTWRMYGHGSYFSMGYSTGEYGISIPYSPVITPIPK